MRNDNDRDFAADDVELCVIDDIPLGDNGKYIHVSIRQAPDDDPIVSAVKIGGKFPNAKLGKFFDPEVARRLGQAYIDASVKLEEILKKNDEAEAALEGATASCAA